MTNKLIKITIHYSDGDLIFHFTEKQIERIREMKELKQADKYLLAKCKICGRELDNILGEIEERSGDFFCWSCMDEIHYQNEMEFWERNG